MYPRMAAVLLSMAFTVLTASAAAAQLWVCSQPDGSKLFTDQPPKDGSCTTYEPASQLVYAPPMNWEKLPPRDPMNETMKAREVQPDTQAPLPETVFEDDRDTYDAPFDSFWEDDEIPVYTYYGVPFFRHKRLPDLSHKPTRHSRHGTTTPSTSLKSQTSEQPPEGAPRVGSETEHRLSPGSPSRRREASGGGFASAPPRESAPYIVPPIGQPATPSTGMRGSSGGQAPAPSRESAPYIVPPFGHEGKR